MRRDLEGKRWGHVYVCAYGFAAAWIVLGLACCGIVARAATFEIADPAEFSKVVATNAVLTTNATINTWLEGPVWVPASGGSGYLLFCDQNNNRLKKLAPPTTVTDFLAPPANTLFNGTMLDAQERLIAAEAGGAGLRISMVTNGVDVPLVTTCNGLRFYSPNQPDRYRTRIRLSGLDR